MVTHRNVVNFFAGMDRVLSPQSGVWLAVTSISFDISVLELFWTLARGFKVVIQSDEEKIIPASDPQDVFEKTSGQWRSVPEQILRHGVTHMQCTPSLAGTLVLAWESFQAIRRLDKLLLGGEALPVSLAQHLRESTHGELINMYGPTETTVWSATHRVNEIGNLIPIGRPIGTRKSTSSTNISSQCQPTCPGKFSSAARVLRAAIEPPGSHGGKIHRKSVQRVGTALPLRRPWPFSL